MPRLYMYGRQQTTTVFGALLSFIITHKIVVLFRSFEDKGDDGGVQYGPDYDTEKEAQAVADRKNNNKKTKKLGISFTVQEKN